MIRPPDLQYSEGEFLNPLINELQQLYRNHYPSKGDSWKEVPLLILIDKLNEEWEEVYNYAAILVRTRPTSKAATNKLKRAMLKELGDLVLVAAFIAARVRNELRNNSAEDTPKVP